ncbi:hypothetical protein FN846DRAFT_892544 [Sphaerosporella brunnea]|uniref:Uncharacterized protein n=1 Tax=Sphaerosporella brunnea TaxID=1250544 RepID=A0A5J5EPW1_9PEZI|nr:hypothetical protein FN846DRAFT_892544 [Sphaerosporella brunnea]
MSSNTSSSTSTASTKTFSLSASLFLALPIARRTKDPAASLLICRPLAISSDDQCSTLSCGLGRLKSPFPTHHKVSTAARFTRGISGAHITVKLGVFDAGFNVATSTDAPTTPR